MQQTVCLGPARKKTAPRTPWGKGLKLRVNIDFDPTKKIVIEIFLVWPRDHVIQALEKLEKLAELELLVLTDHTIAQLKERKKFFWLSKKNFWWRHHVGRQS